ncbi:unnamed protein product [Calicophoron daubneyi]|uniref:Uncharacterized protein n=1 Tax=Calicophoron daubneyi TaxID=300641 RepID=A0AAV2TQF8_CALDB
MQVAARKLTCLQKWIKIIVPSSGSFERDDSLFLELIDVVRDCSLKEATPCDQIFRTVLSTLSEFYSIDVRSTLEPTREDSGNYSLYGRCCLFLLILAMGLRLKCKLFMDTAFKLPSAMHYCVVELTQPLIDESPITLSSFSGLSFDSENQPLTPIHRGCPVKIPVTCPAGGMRFPFSTVGTKAESEAYDAPLRNSKKESGNFYSPLSAGPASRLLQNRNHSSGGKTSIEDEYESASSPLYSLKTILDSPNLISKAQYLSKLEEVRHLSAQLNEVQHLYEEANEEIERLNTAFQNSEVERKEIQIRLKRRERELTELRDELAFAKDSGTGREEAERNADRLRERLHCAMEELKVKAEVEEENQSLVAENEKLRGKLKKLDEFRSRLVAQQSLEQQLCQTKTSLRVAEEKIFDLIRDRERDLAASEAELNARTARCSRCHRIRSASDASPVAKLKCFSVVSLSPDSSQPDIVEDAAPNLSLPVAEVTPDISPESYRAENLSQVVAVNRQLEKLEMEVTSSKTQLLEARRQLALQRFRAIAAQFIAEKRIDSIERLKSDLKTSRQSVDLREKKIVELETELVRLQELVRSTEEQAHVSEEKRGEEAKRWRLREEELVKELRSVEASTKAEIQRLSEECEFNQSVLHMKEDELESMKSQLDRVKSDAEAKVLELSKQSSVRETSLELEIARISALSNEMSITNDHLKDKLAHQLAANEAYRRSSEEELDCLRNKLMSLNTENRSIIQEKNLQLDQMRRNLQSEIDQLKEIKDDALRRACSLEKNLEEAQSNIESLSKELTAKSALAESSAMLLGQTRNDLSLALEKNKRLEAECGKQADQLKTLTGSLSEIQLRLAKEEEENVRNRGRCDSLSEQISCLESEVQHLKSHNDELQSLLDSGQRIRAELECRTDVLRRQMRQAEEEWERSQKQLEDCRAQLEDCRAQLIRLQQEMNVRYLQSAKFDRRLGHSQLGESHDSRIFHSVVNLSPAAQNARPSFGDPTYVAMTSTKLNLQRQPVTDRVSPLLSKHQSGTLNNDTDFTSVSSQSLRVMTPVKDGAQVSGMNGQDFISDPKTRSQSQISGSRPPWDTTAPVSPVGLRRRNVYSGCSPRHHASRFRRLLVNSDEENVENNLEPRPVRVVETRTISEPEETARPSDSGSNLFTRSPLHTSLSSEACTSNYSDVSSAKLSCSQSAVSCVPETPVPWNAPGAVNCRSVSAFDIAKYPVTVFTGKNQSASSVVCTRSNGDSESSRRGKKFSRLWKGKKIRKRDVNSVQIGSANAMSPQKIARFVKPFPPHSHTYALPQSSESSRSESMTSFPCNSASENDVTTPQILKKPSWHSLIGRKK